MEILKKNRLLPEQWDRGGGFAQAGVFGQRGMNGMAARRMVSCKMAAPPGWYSARWLYTNLDLNTIV